MTDQPGVIWALFASVLVHAALAAGLTQLPGPVRFAAVAPGRASHVVYLAEPDVANPPGKLAPGDIGGPIPAQVALSEPIVAFPQPNGSGVTPNMVAGQSAFASAQIPGQVPQAGAGGGPATTSFFGVPAVGRRFVYVLDRSSSMGLHQALATARRELAASLAQLPASASFQVIEYNSTPAPLVGQQGVGEGELVPATAANIRLAAAAMESLSASGTTRHLPALQMALALRPDAIFFLTDADDLDETDPARVARLNAGHCVIHTIELTLAHRGWQDKPLQRIARDSGGTYRAVDPLTR